MTIPDPCPQCGQYSLSSWDLGQNARACKCGYVEEKPGFVKWIPQFWTGSGSSK